MDLKIMLAFMSRDNFLYVSIYLLFFLASFICYRKEKFRYAVLVIAFMAFIFPLYEILKWYESYEYIRISYLYYPDKVPASSLLRALETWIIFLKGILLLNVLGYFLLFRIVQKALMGHSLEN